MACYGSTIGVALGFDISRGYDPNRVQIFRSFVYARWSQLITGQLISDPLNVFVKQEPHKLKKLVEGRVRLICAVSLIDTMLDRIIFGPMVTTQLSKVGHTPCLVGWVPVLGGHRFVRNYLRGNKVLAVDKTAWDWSVKSWMVRAWIHFIESMVIQPPRWWLHMSRTRITMLFRHAQFRFKDGMLVNQPLWGIMKSGCYLTLYLNSVSQSILHYVVMLRMGKSPYSCQPLTFGDDTVQTCNFDHVAYLKHLAELGSYPKVETLGEHYSFVGWDFKPSTVIPSYTEKHVFNILYGKMETKYELLDSLQYLYAHHPEMLYIVQQNLAQENPAAVRALAHLQAFMDGNHRPYMVGRV